MANYDPRNAMDYNGIDIQAGDIVYFLDDEEQVVGRVVECVSAIWYDYGEESDGLQPHPLLEEDEPGVDYEETTLQVYSVQWANGELGDNILGCNLVVQTHLRD